MSPRPVALGLDFGTSNTVAAVADGSGVRVLPLDPGAADARLFRSVLFFPEDGPFLAGSEAIAAYLSLSEGRFLQSLKSFLPSESFRATSLAGRAFTLEALLSLLLRRVRESIERQIGEPVSRVTLGRPARFGDARTDAFAEGRLRRAAEAAGFREIDFRIEPLAASLAHEASLERDELVVTGDFGAGTSDFTVMRLSPSRHREPDRRGDILASGGAYVGGDWFDGAIMERLLPLFGSEATSRTAFGDKRLRMPAHLMQRLLRWHTMSFIRDPETQEYLQRFLRTADRPEPVAALIDLVNHNLGYHLFRAIEGAKVDLSSREATRLRYVEDRVRVDVELTRAEFERCIAPGVGQLEGCLDGVLREAKVTAADVDAVVLTGGSSLIPAIGALFERRFGREKVKRSDAFGAVAEGLAMAAGAG